MNRPSLSFQQLFQNKNDFVTKKSKIGIQTITSEIDNFCHLEMVTGVPRYVSDNVLKGVFYKVH